MASPRRRLDAELVRRGLAPSRERARAAVEAGRVTVGGAPATKASRLVAPGEPVVVHGDGPRFVSRSGAKLDAALDRFALDVAGARALDAGASTGGFTDCLLQRGAREVVAVDVGYGQLHESLRADPRVRNLERTNVRNLAPDQVGGPAEVVVADLSFISLALVAGALVGLAAPGAPVVVLVKPQFEVGRREASKGRGVVTDPALWRSAAEGVIAALAGAGATIMGAMASPLPGADGNIELLVHAVAPAPTPADRSGLQGQGADGAVGGVGAMGVGAMVDGAVAEAEALAARVAASRGGR